MRPGRRAGALIALGFAAASCGGGGEGPSASPTPTPKEPFKVLVFSRTARFRHASIPAAVRAFEALGAEGGFSVDATEDAAAFTDDRLKPYRAVVFLLTTGDVLAAAQQAAFERYIRAGGGYLGVHSASDTEYDWAWYGRLVGAYFKAHPKIQPATLLVVDKASAATKHLLPEWKRADEWYNFRVNPRAAGAHVLLAVDESTYSGGTMGADHPIAWCHTFEGGRSVYTGVGHGEDAYADRDVLAHLEGAVLMAAGAAAFSC